MLSVNFASISVKLVVRRPFFSEPKSIPSVCIGYRQRIIPVRVRETLVCARTSKLEKNPLKMRNRSS